MKKIIKILIMLVLFLNITTVNASFYEIKEEIIQNEEHLIDGTAKDILGDVLITEDLDFTKESFNIFKRASSFASDLLKEGLETLLKVFIIIVISRIFIGFSSDNSLKNMDLYINMASVLSISLLILVDAQNVLSLCSTAVYDIEMLSKGIIPSLVTAITMSGAPTAGALSTTITIFAFDVLITFMSKVLFPMIYTFIAIITVNAAMESDMLKKVSDFIKWISFLSLKVIITLFISYISVSGLITGSADALAVKTTKLAVSSSIPIVGSMISDASETILVGANIIKNAIGVFGILALSSIVILPALKIIINFLMFKTLAVLVSPIATSKMTGLLEGITDGYNLALALISSSFLILFVMFVSAIALVR